MHVLVVLIISRLQPPEDLHSYNMDSLYTIIVYIFSNLYCDRNKVVFHCSAIN